MGHKRDLSKEFDADFNFPKIHLMSHWVEHISRYRALQQYSGKRHAQEHQTNIKDGWNTSNHNPNNLPQVIAIQRCILCFGISGLNLQALAEHGENSAATCKVVCSGADLTAPLSSESYAKPEFRWPRNRRDEKHPDTMIKDSRA